MKIKPLVRELRQFLLKHNLAKKWIKSRKIFESDIRHPSLKTELLEPRWRGIYSFRLDRKHRALFFISDGKAEIFQITKHYKKG